MKAHTITPVLISALLLASTGSQSLATTNYVDISNLTPVSPYTSWATSATNIQDAVHVAVDGATVLVTNGVYRVASQISITNDIVLLSVDGPDSTIIDGGGSSRCLYLNASCLVEGFTVTNGWRNPDGGGIYCKNDTPIIKRCKILGNNADFTGGGVFNGTLIDCVISDNMAYDGGGLYSVVASNCIIYGNTALLDGGGTKYGVVTDCVIYGNGANFGGGMRGGVAENCTIENNEVLEIGGGGYEVKAYNSMILSNTAYDAGGLYKGYAYNCTISGNSADRQGGGVASVTADYCSINSNSASLAGGVLWGEASNCTIAGNTALKTAAGVYDCIVVDSVISNNFSSNAAGGMYKGSAYNCTISGNSATDQGGGIMKVAAYNCAITSNSAAFGGGMSWGVATNCIFSGNSATTNGAAVYDATVIDCVISSNASSVWIGGMYLGSAYNCTFVHNTAASDYGGTYESLVYNSIVYSNSAPGVSNISGGTAINSCSPDLLHGMSGNITNAPSFVDAGAGNYRLSVGSPCVDAGDNSYVSTPSDLDEQPRIVGGIVDMGAYESGFPGCSVTNCNVTGSKTVLEWAAYPMWNASVYWSTNLATMPFTNLMSDIPYPVNSFTDLVHCAHGQCFYQVEIAP